MFAFSFLTGTSEKYFLYSLTPVLFIPFIFLSSFLPSCLPSFLSSFLQLCNKRGDFIAEFVNEIILFIHFLTIASSWL